MSCLFSACGNLCACLSCYADAKYAIIKLCPCFRRKEPELTYKEEVFKIKFLNNTIVSFERIVAVSYTHLTLPTKA